MCLDNDKSRKTGWVVYVLECGDGTLYTGITNDLDRRLNEHQSGNGAKYTKGRDPIKIAYSEAGHTRSSASKREINIKSLTRLAKLSLINNS